MRCITIMISTVLLVTVSGFSETIITAQDYAVDSDVVLESAVREIKSAPRDAINVVGDGLKYVKDETITAAKGAIAVFSGASPHEKAQKAGELAVENAWDSSNDILFRSYKVSDEIGELLLTSTEEGLDDTPSIDVSGFFDGIGFPKKTSAYYMPKLERLLVRQTMDNILAIENVLSDYQSTERELLNHQVEIETKFVEVSQKTLNELGFSWRFGSKDGGDWKIIDDLYLPAGQDILASGLRTAASAIGAGTDPGVLAIGSAVTENLQWDVFVSALEQADDADVLSAPRVVTRDGSTAIIEVGEAQMVPQSFDINDSDTSPFVEHSDWEPELLGVTLEVTPEIREEGLIELELHPMVVDIAGHDTYEVQRSHTARGGGGVRPTLNASLPYLRVRELETRVTVADGSTIGMGGLIYDKLETFRDKVPVLGSIPFLGRLFRSEGERSIKRNLMIFVTATQVDIDGRRSADVVLNK